MRGQPDILGVGGEDETAVRERFDGNGDQAARIGERQLGNDSDADLFTHEGEKGSHVADAEFRPQVEAGRLVHLSQQRFTTAVGKYERIVAEVGQ